MADFDLDFGVRVSNVDAALRDIGRVESANRQMAQTTQQASATSTRAVQQLGTSVQQMGQRAGQTVGAIGQMAGQLGQVAGLSTSAGAAISQLGGAVGALSGAMGPLGVALGVVTLAVTAFNTALNFEANRHREAEQAARDHAEQIRALATAARQARAELTLQRDIAESIGSVGGEQLQQQAEDRRRRVLELERTRAERLAGLGLVERNGQVFRRNAFGEIAASLPAGFESGDGSRAEIARLREEVTSIERELVRREEQTAADQTAAGQRSILDANAAEKARMLDRQDAGRRRGGSSGPSASEEALAAYYERLEQMDRQVREQEQRRIESMRFLEDAEKEHQQELQRLAQETADEQKRLDEEKRQQAREQQEELKATAEESSRDFRESWRGSLMDVIDAWREANTAMRNAGGQMLSTSELLRVGMTSVGNEIADTIGGTMKGAFEQALGAWLDGSKSFVEAAEEMARGVLKALVVESIVQAVVEGARAIASAASYDFSGAALHAAAAAAWAAVGVAAGGVGAAIGGFGGGGGKDAPSASTAVTPTDASTSAQQSQPMVINVYPGGFTTRREVVAGVYDAIREGAREGYVLPADVMGG